MHRRVGCKAYPTGCGPNAEWCLAAQAREYDGMCRGCQWRAVYIEKKR